MSEEVTRRQHRREERELPVTIERDDTAHDCIGVTLVAKVVTMPDAPPEQAMSVVGRLCIFQHSVYTTEIFHAHIEPEYRGHSILKKLYKAALSVIRTPVVVTGAWLEHEAAQKTLTEVGFNRIAQIHSEVSGRQVVCYAMAHDPVTRVIDDAPDIVSLREQILPSHGGISLPDNGDDEGMPN